MSLTPKQERFVEEYLLDTNATQAAARAGYKQPHVQGPRLLGNVRVAEAIAGRRKSLSAKLEISVERVLQEYARIAFADIRNLFVWDEERACYVPSGQLTDDEAAAISEIHAETTRSWVGSGEASDPVDTIKLKIKTYDKKGALDSLAKHLGLFIERVEHSGRDGGPIETKDVTDAELQERATQLTNRIAPLVHATTGNGKNGNGNGRHP